MKINEEMSVGSGAVAGLGIGPQGEPGVRRGKFAGHDTFILKRTAFNSLKDAKKKGKHWRTYLEEDDAYSEIRDYARKNKGPIVAQCEATGACMFVRYGNGNLFEAAENSVGKDARNWLSDAGKDARDVRSAAKNNYGKDKYLGKFRGQYVRRTSFGQGDAAYHLQDPKTKKITHSVNGSERNGVLTVGGASSTGDSDIKMHDFYHHLIKKHLKALVGTDHSPGAKKVWQKLAKKRNVSMHGWVDGKPVNLDPQDEDETHAPRKPDGYDERTPEEKKIAKTKLVASIVRKKK